MDIRDSEKNHEGNNGTLLRLHQNALCGTQDNAVCKNTDRDHL